MHRAGELHDLGATQPADGGGWIEAKQFERWLHGIRTKAHIIDRLPQRRRHGIVRMKVLASRQNLENALEVGLNQASKRGAIHGPPIPSDRAQGQWEYRPRLALFRSQA